MDSNEVSRDGSRYLYLHTGLRELGGLGESRELELELMKFRNLL